MGIIYFNLQCDGVKTHPILYLLTGNLLNGPFKNRQLIRATCFYIESCTKKPKIMGLLEKRVESFSLNYKNRHLFKLGDKAKSDNSRVNLIKSCDNFLSHLCLLHFLCVKQYQQILFVVETHFGCKCSYQI